LFIAFLAFIIIFVFIHVFTTIFILIHSDTSTALLLEILVEHLNHLLYVLIIQQLKEFLLVKVTDWSVLIVIILLILVILFILILIHEVIIIIIFIHFWGHRFSSLGLGHESCGT
jgi:hypothetical protein